MTKHNERVSNFILELSRIEDARGNLIPETICYLEIDSNTEKGSAITHSENSRKNYGKPYTLYMLSAYSIITGNMFSCYDEALKEIQTRKEIEKERVLGS